MLRTPLLSSSFFTSTRSRKTSRMVKKSGLLNNKDTDDILRIQMDIERMKAHWAHAEGRQEKAYIKIIIDLEKKRDDLLGIKEKE
tara:strand:- start:3425 stop:3679 length:255 start_codon:yes stop_codon:yes gene_type:complete